MLCWRASHAWKAMIVAVCAASAPAAADVDLNGPWRVNAATSPYFNPDLSCIVDVVQIGSALTVTGNDCSLPINLSGTIDPMSGVFSASGSSNPFFCPSLSISGTAPPAGTGFGGTFSCTGVIPVTGPFSAGLCANGELDAAEDCDDGNLNTHDCCAPTCEFDAVNEFCFGPDTDCNDNGCDGAGTCVGDPGPPGVRCESDFNGCTNDVCDAAGNCTHPDLPVGTACELDFNVCTDDTCDGAGECVAAPNTGPCDDYNTCTIGDQCAAGSCVPGASFAPTGTGCNTDADLCTIDECDGAGGCQNVDCSSCCGGPSCVEQVSSICATPAEPSAKLQLSRREGDPEYDRLTFKWAGPTDLADLGDPSDDTDYELCLYQIGDFPPSQPRLRYQGRAGAGGNCGEKACWRSSASGFSFKDPELDPDGLYLLKLRGGGNITAKGRGANIGWDRLDFLAAPLTMQLKASNGMCWSATWDTLKSRKFNRLKATGGQ